jgi:UDP-glucose 4-epimerase
MGNILITGGNGFIASHLVDALVDLKQKVNVLDLYPRQYDKLPEGVNFVQGNLQDVNVFRRVMEDRQVELVVHAAWANIHETSLKDPVGDVQTNLVASINLLNACRDLGVKRVVFISSGGTVYGLPRNLPIHEGHPENPISAYGITKLMVEKYLKMYYHLYGLEYIILRPSVPYGPRQNPFHNQGAVAVFIYKALMGKPITIYGHGKVVRDYFYIGDLTRALLAAQDVPFDPIQATFNLGGSIPYTLDELVEKLEMVLGKKIIRKYEPARKFDVPQLLLDTSLAKSQLNWIPTTSLDEGILQTAEWLKKWIIDV